MAGRARVIQRGRHAGRKEHGVMDSLWIESTHIIGILKKTLQPGRYTIHYGCFQHWKSLRIWAETAFITTFVGTSIFSKNPVPECRGDLHSTAFKSLGIIEVNQFWGQWAFYWGRGRIPCKSHRKPIQDVHPCFKLNSKSEIYFHI